MNQRLRLAVLLSVPALLAACQPAPTPTGSGAAIPLGDYQLLRMGDQDVEANHVTMLLQGDQVGGLGFCNPYSGAQTAPLPKLAIGPIASTRKACGGDLMQLDRTYLAALEGASSASLADGRLTITGTGQELVYEPHVPDQRD